MFSREANPRKSPIKPSEKPLPNAGDSTAKRQENIFDEFAWIYIFSSIVVAVAIMEWIRFWTQAGNQRWIFTLMAAASCLYTAYRIRDFKTQVINSKRGLEAEKSVGQTLELLRSSGAQVFHDIPFDGFNIDHVVIDQSGVYAVETKSLGKPEKNAPKLFFNGDVISEGDVPLKRSPVEQANACAQALSALLQESTGKNIPVKPVVLFPGRYVQAVGKGNKGETWVLNPKVLQGFIKNSAVKIKEDEVHLFSMHLSMYVRTRQLAA